MSKEFIMTKVRAFFPWMWPCRSGNAAGRTNESQRVFVSPVGLGIEDVAEAWRVVRRAQELGIGTPLRWWERPVWT